MVSIDPDMYLKKEFLALVNGNALHENASFRRAAFVGPRGGDKLVGRPSNLCCLLGLSQVGL